MQGEYAELCTTERQKQGFQKVQKKKKNQKRMKERKKGPLEMAKRSRKKSWRHILKIENTRQNAFQKLEVNIATLP